VEKTTAGLCRIGKRQIDDSGNENNGSVDELGITRNPACWRLCRYRHKRHAFAVHRLLRWYREGADGQAKLPLLATYLGHCTLLSTQYYLTATPELLAEASRRFQDGFGSVIRLSEELDDIR
jgi:hypothetical protein